MSGDELLRSEKRGKWPGFGIDRLDDIFGDEWDGVGILEVAGMRRVGKSVSRLSGKASTLGFIRIEQLLALYASLRKMVEDETAVCRWLDMDGSFSPTRARAILESMGVVVSSR